VATVASGTCDSFSTPAGLCVLACAADFRPGQLWLDTDGLPIQAHGGCILEHNSVYYWYGEQKDGLTYINPDTGYVRTASASDARVQQCCWRRVANSWRRGLATGLWCLACRLARVDAIGISCYSSTDLLNWVNEGP
jgi:hypothetical protein